MCEVELCAICEKPIVPNEDAVYTIPTKEGRYRHYACWDKHHNPRTIFADMRESLNKFETALNKAKSTIRGMK